MTLFLVAFALLAFAGLGGEPGGITLDPLQTPFSQEGTGTISPPYAGRCEAWAGVSQAAFGLDSSYDGEGLLLDPPPALPFSAEEGFEVLVFRDQLYLGMEADNFLGTRLWRTRSGVRVPAGQQDWEEVSLDAAGNPFGAADRAQNDHVDSLAEFGGGLYASTANRSGSPTGTRLYRSPSGDPGSWEDAQGSLGAGFGDPANENFKDMQVFDGWLCGGTWNETSGAQVWCSRDGGQWVLKNRPGFGPEGPDPNTPVIWSGMVFDGGLYFGAAGRGADPEDLADDQGLLFRTFDLNGEPAWERVFGGPAGSGRVDLLGELGGWLYIAHASPQGLRIWRSLSGDPGSWVPAGPPGMDGNPRNYAVLVDGAVVYNRSLYVAVANPDKGVGVWRRVAEGDRWELAGGHGLGDPRNILAELAVFNGYLYAWTSNYHRGQQVLSTRCPICQSAAVSGGGTYHFGEVGVAVSYRKGPHDALEVCVAPSAADMTGIPRAGEKLASRVYWIRPSPPAVAFSADLTLTVPAGGGENNREQGAVPFLLHWTGRDWEACPEANRGWGPASADGPASAAYAVSCTGVVDFASPWVIMMESSDTGLDISPRGVPAGSLFMVLLGFGLLAVTGLAARFLLRF